MIIHFSILDTNWESGQKKVSLLVRCPDFRGCHVHKQGVWDRQMCPVYQGALISGCPDYKGVPPYIGNRHLIWNRALYCS